MISKNTISHLNIPLTEQHSGANNVRVNTFRAALNFQRVSENGGKRTTNTFKRLNYI